MKHSPVLALLALLVVGPGLAAAPADKLETRVSLLIGFPEEREDSVRGALIVPGTVIPVPEARQVVEKYREKEEAANARLVQVADGLRKTMRLAKIDVSYRLPLTLEVDSIRDLPAPSSTSDVRLSIKLLGFDDRSASYEVQFFERSTAIADTRLAATRGQRAVVGGLNGDEAPYLFLVIEPHGPKSPSAADEGPFKLDLSRMTPPRAIYKTSPAYPEEARKAKLEGAVILQTIIGKDGAIKSMEVVRDDSGGRFGAAAAEAVWRWKFEPATLDGAPVEVYYHLTVNFRLGDKKITEKP